MPIKAVVFDFGGVLLSYERLSAIWEDIDREHNLKPGSISKLTKGAEFSAWLGPDRGLFHGGISIEEIESGIFTEFVNLKCGTKITAKIKPFSPALGPKANHIYNHKLCAVLKQLRDLGFKTALLTNNCHIDKAKIESRLPFDLSQFDVVVESCLENMVKPEPEIYQLTASRLGFKPEELVFLDDLKENVDAAKNLGWSGIHVDPSNEAVAVDSLEQLLGCKFQFEN